MITGTSGRQGSELPFEVVNSQLSSGDFKVRFGSKCIELQSLLARA
jgi:hypothetical protein